MKERPILFQADMVKAILEGRKTQTRRIEIKWRPSIFMHRWASRIVLEVKAVRVERLQEISILDASNEGCYAGGVLERADDGAVKRVAGTSREAYSALWDSLNAKRGFGWETNPWVWVVEFARVWRV